MTITISEFALGVIATIGVELGALILTTIYCVIRYSLKSRRKQSK